MRVNGCNYRMQVKKPRSTPIGTDYIDNQPMSHQEKEQEKSKYSSIKIIILHSIELGEQIGVPITNPKNDARYRVVSS